MRKDSGTAYILWALGICGVCGIQRFYLGQPVPGLLYLFTFGICGIGQLIDLFLIPSEVRAINSTGGMTSSPQQNIVVQLSDSQQDYRPTQRQRSYPAIKERPTSLAHKILEECANPHPISLSQIIIATGEPIDQIKSTVKELCEQELLTQTINDDGIILYKTQ